MTKKRFNELKMLPLRDYIMFWKHALENPTYRNNPKLVKKAIKEIEDAMVVYTELTNV